MADPSFDFQVLLGFVVTDEVALRSELIDEIGVSTSVNTPAAIVRVLAQIFDSPEFQEQLGKFGLGLHEGRVRELGDNFANFRIPPG